MRLVCRECGKHYAGEAALVHRMIKRDGGIIDKDGVQRCPNCVTKVTEISTVGDIIWALYDMFKDPALIAQALEVGGFHYNTEQIEYIINNKIGLDNQE